MEQKISIINDQGIRTRLKQAFRLYFVNYMFEIIIHPKENTYFQLSDVTTEVELEAKILEWLSREASQSFSKQSQKYHLEGINKFLETSFNQKQMEQIYTHLGNRCNHEKTIAFIESGYDFSLLESE